MHYLYLTLLISAHFISAANLTDTFDKGLHAFSQHDYQTAATHFAEANAMSPNKPELLFNLACCHIELGNSDDAINVLRRVIELKPDYIKAYGRLIALLKKCGITDGIEDLYKQLLLHNEHDTQAHLALARTYKSAEQFDASIAHYSKAIETEPHNKSIGFELAIVYTLVGQTENAIKLYDDILSMHPDNVTAVYNKGYALKMEGSCDEAIACYKKALHLNNAYNEAHFALGIAYLNKGDYEQGWTQHARFLKQMDRNADKLRTYLKEGSLSGKTILLRPEGGLGDSINFIRYARQLKQYGCKVVVAVQKPVYQLLKNCPGVDQLVTVGDSLCPFDDHTTLMSIPAILYSHEHQLPTFQPYVFPDPELVTYWGEYLKHDTNFKVGICWEASVYNDSSRPPVARRGMPLEALYLLSEIEGITLYSLQQQDGIEQLNGIPPYVKIHRFDETFDKDHGSFMDTAAVMQHLDLIISVDTAIAHLAGAMEKPVWLMLPWATDWRWLAHQTSSPWYPTMRIFKQPKPFDWESAVHEVFWALTDTVENRFKH